MQDFLLIDNTMIYMYISSCRNFIDKGGKRVPEKIEKDI